MKSFIIQLPKRNEDSTGAYKSNLLNKVFTKYPWLTDDATSRSSSLPYDVNISYAGPEDGIQFGKKHSLFDVNFSPSAYVNDLKKRKNAVKYYDDTEADVYDLYNDYSAAMDRIEAFAKMRKPRNRRETYDFRLPTGECVVIHNGFIQIGSEIIPRYNNFGFFNSLPKYRKVTIVTMVVSVSTYLVA